MPAASAPKEEAWYRGAVRYARRIRPGSERGSMRATVLVGLVAVGTVAAVAGGQNPAPALAHTFEKVADGVYAAASIETAYPNSNSLVIVNADDVVLVDSHITPATARRLVEDIKTITPKPIRYVIDTHYHFDHASGNQIFGPDVQVIGHEYVRRMLQSNVLQQQTFKTLSDALPGQIEQAKQQLASETDLGKRAQLQARIAALAAHVEAQKEIQPTPPNVTYQTHMTLYRGNREIQLHFFGRGHTGGDTVVFLPKERVVATGDLLLYNATYLADGFINEYPETLSKLAQLDFETVVPGHGFGVPGGRISFTGGKERIQLFQDYLRDLWSQGVALRKQGLTAAEAAKKIDLTKHQRFIPQLTMPGVDVRTVERMYDVMDGRIDPR